LRRRQGRRDHGGGAPARRVHGLLRALARLPRRAGRAPEAESLMSAAQVAGAPAGAEAGGAPEKRGWSTKRKLLLIGAVYILGLIVIVALTGAHGTRNEAFKPQNEFKLETWVNLGIFSINKAVMYLVIAAALTSASMIYIARRMQDRPNRVQTAVETVYQLMRDNIAGGNLQGQMLARWFPFIGAL